MQNAAVGLCLPYERALNDAVTLSDGKEAGRQDGTDEVYVTPGYFETLQMPVLAGRTFTDADGPNAQHVAVVNQAFARKFYGGTNPVGRYVNKDTEIVGEVADVPVSSGLYEGAPLMTEQAMYIPAAQVPVQYTSVVHVWFQPDWIVRTAGPVAGLTGQMQRALASVDPNLPFSGFYAMRDLLAKTLATPARRSGAPRRDGGTGSVAERGRHFRVGGQHGGPTDARNRHPHGPGLDRRQSHGRDWPLRGGRRGARPISGTGPLCGSAASDAQRALRRGRI